MPPGFPRIHVKSSNLPRKFVGVFPLYLGAEAVLGITLFNKCSGAYGLLALFNGHPLDFMQWLSYLWSVFNLIVLAPGLYQIHKPSLLTFSQIFVVFSLDTVLTCFFTLWFSSAWFTLEQESSTQTAAKIVSTTLSQGATEEYEYNLTLALTLLALVGRLYFNFILAAFVQALLHHPKYMVDQDDVERELHRASTPWVKRLWLRNQKFCYRISKHFLN